MEDKLNFDVHIQSKISKCSKIIGIVKRLSILLLQDALLTLYKINSHWNILILICIITIQIKLIATEHLKMKLLEHSDPELKVLNIHFSHTVSKNGTT